MTKKEYESFVYTRYLFRPFLNRNLPQNTISATPIKIFGILIGVKARLAKTGYPWSK